MPHLPAGHTAPILSPTATTVLPPARTAGAMGRRIALCMALCVATGLAHAQRAVPDPAVCAELKRMEPEAFSRLAERVEAERRAGGGADTDRLAACGLDYEALRERQCGKAYSAQNLEFLLRHCRFEAWSLARAQCERNLDSISPRYADFCRAFGRE
jgi:hypothetical protein